MANAITVPPTPYSGIRYQAKNNPTKDANTELYEIARISSLASINEEIDWLCVPNVHINHKFNHGIRYKYCFPTYIVRSSLPIAIIPKQQKHKTIEMYFVPSYATL